MSPHKLPARLGLLLAASLAGTQTIEMPKVEVESDAKADFTTFKTYRWKDSQVPADNEVVHTSLVVYVERGLQGKGLAKKAEGDVDLLVRYYTSRTESLQGVASQPHVPAAGNPGDHSTRIDMRKQASGRLVLELYRASDQALVWKASTVSPNIDKNRLDAEVSTAVRLLMTKYPPKPAAR